MSIEVELFAVIADVRQRRSLRHGGIWCRGLRFGEDALDAGSATVEPNGERNPYSNFDHVLDEESHLREQVI